MLGTIIERSLGFGDHDQIGKPVMARIDRKSGMKEVPVRLARKEDHSEYRVENDPRFLRRIEQARASLQAGRGVRLEDIETE
jgi:hypothetical protein